MKTNQLTSKTGLCLIAAFVMFGALSGASGSLIESFESGTLDGWNAPTINGSAGAVDTTRASDGIYSYGITFTVPASYANNFNVPDILDRDPRTFLDPGTTTFSLDAYSDWTNPNGWGNYANTIELVINSSIGGFHFVDPTSGSLVNGSFQTFTFDLSPYAADLTDPSNGFSTLQVAWLLGVYADNGNPTDNGTQTLAIDNIQAVPEPSTYGALAGLTLTGFSLTSVIRRRVSSTRR